MGGGTSKAQEGGANDSKSTSNGNSGAKGADGAASRALADDAAAVRTGLVCTVTDAVSNVQVPFLSSVAAVKPKKGRKASLTQSADTDPSSADIVIRYEEAIVITGTEVVSRSVSAPVSSPTTASSDTASNASTATADPVRVHMGSVAQLKLAQSLDRGSWRSTLGLLEPSSYVPQPEPTTPTATPVSSTFSSPGKILVGGAVLTQPAATSAVPPHAPHSPTETEKLRRSAMLAAKTKYAAPTNFSLTTCGGQSGAIRAIASSADGNQFASVLAPSKTAQYIDAATNRIIMEIKGHSDPIVAIAHSRDGKFLLTSSTDGTVCMWDLNNGKKLREVGVNSQANSVAISDDSEIIATSSTEDFVNLWESKNGDALTLFQRHSGAVYCVGFARRGNLVASGSQNGEVFVWGVQVGDVRHHIETGARAPVLCVSFSLDSTRLVTADREILQVWDMFTGGLIMTRNGSGDAILGEQGRTMHNSSYVVPAASKEIPRITSASFAACNTIVVGLTTKRVIVIEPNNGVELLSVELRAIVTCLSVNWSGDVVFIGDYAGNHYRLAMNFAHRDVIEYNLNSKPPSKERGKEKD